MTESLHRLTNSHFFRWLTFLLMLTVCLLFTLDSAPLLGDPADWDTRIFEAYRIGFGLVMLLRIAASFPAIPMIYGRHSRMSGGPGKLLFGLQMLFALCFTIGFMSWISASGLLLIHLFVFNRSNYYSIEEIYVQFSLLHMPFMPLAAAYSVDSLIGTASPLETTYAVNSFLVCNGLVMFSAGYEKLKSLLWLRGRGSLEFLRLPHLVNRRFRFIGDRLGFLLIPAGVAIMLAEFLFPFCLMHPTLFVACAILLWVFSLQLFVVVDLSFIGQVLCLNLSLLLMLSISNLPEAGNWQLPEFSMSWQAVPFLMVQFLSLLVFCFHAFAQRLHLPGILRWLSGFIVPVGVFTEKHLFGLYTYRLVNEEGGALLEAFDEIGSQGPAQRWTPRFYQSAMYLVTDFCLSWNRNDGSGLKREEEVRDLLYAAHKQSAESERIELQVKAIHKDASVDSYFEAAWTPVYSYSPGSRNQWKQLEPPPVVTHSFR